METALKFDLLGKYAFLKNPESNTGTEFSFEHLHKPCLLGILGCILGMNGKAQLTKEKPDLEYYENLRNIKVSIVPSKPVFNKFKETITDTTGYANDGSTQILDKKILQNVCWTIYILKDSIQEQYWNELCYLLQKHESKYPLYLGNNSYKAKVDGFEIVNLDEVEDTDDITITSIFKEEIVEEFNEYTESDMVIPYNLEIYAPGTLNELTLYEYKWFRFTNLMVTTKDNKNLYSYDNSILGFI
ncbi:hypothetical protein KPL35_11700 [Clostridium sp. CF011]|uniref:hypothetical protein n=1 Tax=Clostridium sp. CF011 TaxID=2843318 RepID=UPI001C0B444A|nr:hypothetical protein [Clostridium sp. CF011]MBU3092739.1 hypothetical protein [Clostridium sp. CF011]WAG71160.1 hypothetical protein LL036_07010 [Clostridium sp. CF011]